MPRNPLLALTLFGALTVPALAQVQAPVLKWQRGGCTSWCQTGWYASPAVADLDGNGSMEVIWSAYSVFVVRGVDGADVWTVPNGHDLASAGGSSVGRTWPGVVVADVDGDAALEIVTAHSDGWVSVYRADGYFESGWPRQVTNGSELRTLAVYDVDGDGQMEIGVGATQSDDQWYVLEPDGSVRAGWPQLPSGLCCATGLYNENIAFGDLDGDGVAEIMGPNDTHYVAAFYADGRSVPANAMFGANKYWRDVGVWIPLAAELRGYGNCGPEDRPNWNSGGLIVVDVDGNGANEVIGVGNVHDCSYSPYLDIYDQAYVWNGDRSRWSNGSHDWTVLPNPTPGAAPLSEDYNVIETSQPNAVAADLDGDGEMEILYASYDGRLHCYTLGKVEPGNWPLEVYNPAEGFFRFVSEPAVADLDGDGRAEVIFGSWPQKSSNGVGFLHIADADGNELYRTPVPAVAGDWNGILAAPTLANIDGDPDLEAVVGTSATGIVAFDLPGTQNARVIWGTGRGNQQRSGGYLSYPISADFSGSPLIGPAPLPVVFTDLSTGPVTSWSWTFGDGQTSAGQSPSHTYTTPGVYTVALTVSNGSSSDTLTRTGYVDVTSGTWDRILAAPGPGAANPNTIRLLEPDGRQVGQFTAYSAGGYGANARAGFVASTASPSILTGPGPGPVFGPQVRAFASSGTPVQKVNFYAYGTLKYGVRAGAGDVDGDGWDEIVSGAGPGAVFGPHVRAFNFDGASLGAIAKINFFAYGTLKYGVNVAAGEIDGDAFDEIVTGPGPGAIFGAQVRAFDYDGTGLGAIAKVNFSAFTSAYGCAVALGSVDADGPAEIVVGAGRGPANAARVRGFDFDGGSVSTLPGFDATPFSSLYGATVAAGDMSGDGIADAEVGAGADPSATGRHAAYRYDGAALTPLSYSSFDAFAALRYGLEVGSGPF